MKRIFLFLFCFLALSLPSYASLLGPHTWGWGELCAVYIEDYYNEDISSIRTFNLGDDKYYDIYGYYYSDYDSSFLGNIIIGLDASVDEEGLHAWSRIEMNYEDLENYDYYLLSSDDEEIYVNSYYDSYELYDFYSELYVESSYGFLVYILSDVDKVDLIFNYEISGYIDYPWDGYSDAVVYLEYYLSDNDSWVYRGWDFDYYDSWGSINESGEIILKEVPTNQPVLLNIGLYTEVYGEGEANFAHSLKPKGLEVSDGEGTPYLPEPLPAGGPNIPGFEPLPQSNPVPEPATGLLLAAGLGLIPLVRRKKK